MKPPTPPAYLLARSLRVGLHEAYEELVISLTDSAVATRLRTLEQLIQGASPAINMSLANCVSFLETGEWLNMYEIVAKEIGKGSGPLYWQMLREKWKGWYRPRIAFERLLRFKRNVHYASLNLDGPGPTYGSCCVRFGAGIPIATSTIFAGDPLRIIFDAKGKQIMSQKDVFKRFGIFDDRCIFAAVHLGDRLLNSLVIDKDALVRAMDDTESLIEVHIHGEVRSEHATEIAIRADLFDAVSRKCVEYEIASPQRRAAKYFDDVPVFKRLLQLVEHHKLRLLRERRA